MLSKEQLARLAEVAPWALEAADGDEALVRVSLAQWAIESGWGSKSIMREDDSGKIVGVNPFGIKAKRGQESVEVPTREELTDPQIAALQRIGKKILSVGPLKGNGKRDVVLPDDFAIFSSLEAAFRAHAEFIRTGLFAEAWVRYRAGVRTVERLLVELQSVPYATDSNYVAIAKSIARSQEVLRAIEKARASKV